MSVSTAEHRSAGDPLTAAVSSAVVSVLREYTGRGPTRARTTIRGDVLVVLLEDTLTRGEQALVRNEQADKVIDIRKAFQDAMRDECIARVSKLVGRTVVAMMSANHIDPDLGVEIFILGGRLGDADDSPAHGAAIHPPQPLGDAGA